MVLVLPTELSAPRSDEALSSIVPVEKKDGRWRVAIDFRDLNRATGLTE
jgi:hypothetical protein